MSDPPMLRIGPFSRASSLSIKALRFYHETGLLVPAVVDPETGYRSYSPAQLIDAAVIHRLRDLDVPLDSIREVLTARDPAVTQKVLGEHAALIEARVRDVAPRGQRPLRRGRRARRCTPACSGVTIPGARCSRTRAARPRPTSRRS